MSIPKPKKSLLSATEKERLKQHYISPDLPDEEVDKLSNIRKRNDLVVRNKIKSWLNNIEDINFVLQYLPKRQSRKIISDDEVYSLLRVLESLLEVLVFMPIEQTTRGQAIVSTTSTKEMVRRANEADYERNRRLWQFANVLKEHYSSPEEVKQLECYNTLRVIDIAKRLGDPIPSNEVIEKFKEQHNMDNAPQTEEPPA